MTTEELPAGTVQQRRRRWPMVLFTLLVLGAAAATAAHAGIFRRIHVHLSPAVAVAPKPKVIAVSPGCSPGGLWLIWKVEDDGDTLNRRSGATTSAQLFADVGRLERRLANDPHRWRFVWILRGIESNTVGGHYATYKRDLSTVVQSEPRC